MLFFFGLISFLLPQIIFAGTNGDLAPLVGTIKDWLEGSFGVGIAIASLGAAAYMAIVEQRLLLALGAVGIALLAGFGPLILQSVFTAALL
jgi:hypothetical protein